MRWTYQCCFCASPIVDPGKGVRITLVGMNPERASQDLFAHLACLKDRFGPTLAAETMFDADVFAPN